MSKYKCEDKITRILFENLQDEDNRPYTIATITKEIIEALAGCDHAEKLKDEVASKTFGEWWTYPYVKNEEGCYITDICKDIAEEAWRAALEIGKNIGKEEHKELHKLPWCDGELGNELEAAQKTINEMQAVYNSLIDCAARDTEKINQLKQVILEINEEYNSACSPFVLGGIGKILFENQNLIKELRGKNEKGN